jgi:uncharacterized membrane protein YecN with MAPEG domain
MTTSSLIACKRFWRVSIKRIESGISDLVQRVQEVSQNNGDYVKLEIIFIYIDSLEFHQTWLVYVLMNHMIQECINLYFCIYLHI